MLVILQERILLTISNYVFTVIFLLEMIIKVNQYRYFIIVWCVIYNILVCLFVSLCLRRFTYSLTISVFYIIAEICSDNE